MDCKSGMARPPHRIRIRPSQATDAQDEFRIPTSNRRSASKSCEQLSRGSGELHAFSETRHPPHRGSGLRGATRDGTGVISGPPLPTRWSCDFDLGHFKASGPEGRWLLGWGCKKSKHVTNIARQSATPSSSPRGIYRSRTIRAVSKPFQLVRSRTDQPSLA